MPSFGTAESVLLMRRVGVEPDCSLETNPGGGKNCFGLERVVRDVRVGCDWQGRDGERLAVFAIISIENTKNLYVLKKKSQNQITDFFIL